MILLTVDKMKNKTILELYKRPQTVFTLKEISLLFPNIPYDNLKEQITYFAKSGPIKNIHRGIYVKDNFDPLELANKLYVPSYVSLETVLQKAGVTFQYYERIFTVSYVTRTVEVDRYTIEYKRIRKDILLNKRGVEEQNNVAIASVERAFMDAVYLYKNYHFDNLSTLDWDKIIELRTIYASQAFNKRIDEYYQIYKEEHA